MSWRRTLDPLRKVIGVRFVQMPYTRLGWGQNALSLECGHTTSRKTSIPVPSRAQCYECGMGRSDA